MPSLILKESVEKIKKLRYLTFSLLVLFISCAVKKEIKRQVDGRGKHDVKKWLEGFYGKHGQYIQEQIGPVFRSFAEAIQVAVERELGVEANAEELNVFVAEYIETYAKRHTSSSLGQLVALLEEELEALPIRVDEWR